MKATSVDEFKRHFYDMLEQVKAGLGFAVTYVCKNKFAGFFFPKFKISKSQRKLGILEEKATVNFKADFQISEEDLY